MIYALAAYVFAATLTFLQQNLQFIDPYYKDKQNLIILAFSLPIAYLYLYAWTYFVNNSNGSVWSARFIFFGLSYLVYPVLTYICLGESPFAIKTILCTVLSIVIILIQYKL
jgi:hypothetical protein